jgi:hypothetical protein
MLNFPVGACIQGIYFQFLIQEISYDPYFSLQTKVLVVTFFLSEELKIYTILIFRRNVTPYPKSINNIL